MKENIKGEIIFQNYIICKYSIKNGNDEIYIKFL